MNDAEKKFLVGYVNVMKSVDPETRIPSFAFAIFTDQSRLPFVQVIGEGKIRSFCCVDLPLDSIERSDEK